MEEGAVAKVLNDFLTLSEGEISLKKGDITQVLERVDRHWWYGCCGGRYGKFPASHLIAVDVPTLEDNHELFASIAGFSKQQDGDLSFSRGELIVGISQVNEDWWFGCIENRTGIFPTTYTWQLDSKLLKNKLKTKTMNRRARVKMNMKAQLQEEMDLHEGDLLIVTEIIDKNWYRGKCGSREGIFPSAYVQLLEDNDVEMPATTSHARLNSDIDSLLTLSPEAQFPPASAMHSDSNVFSYSNLEANMPPPASVVDNDSNVFDDDYFKVNMPSLYRDSSIDQTFSETSESYINSNSQPLVELDIVPYGITLYPFYAQFDNELSFHEGEIVTLIRHIDKDWTEGKIDGKKGIFPKNYVNILVDCDTSTNTPNSFSEPTEESKLKTVLAPESFAKVLYNFDAQMTGDITVHKDDVVLIVGEVNGDWCEVKNQSGKIGLCPRNHLTAYIYPHEVENKLARTMSLVTDTISEDKRLKYHTSQLAEIETTIFEEKSHNENTVSKNLEGLYINSQARSSSVDIVNTRDLSTILPEPSLEPSRHTSLPLPPASPLPPEPSNSEAEVEVRLRRDESRRSVDRLPHRPAPPAPVPGHKPVRRSLRRVSPPECTLPQKSVSSEDEAVGGAATAKGHSCIPEEQRKKNAEQRQNVISELVFTEKEYVRDLKITYETFNLHNPRHLEARGVDVKVVFGNILEVMHLAENLLDTMQLAMKGKDEEDQCIGPCFIEVADEMKNVYGQYCMNHDNALTLLERYETIEEIQAVFNKGIETLRYQIACFDMGSILIKPVQRILKYPLILNELIKCTEDSHKDKPSLLLAVRTMMEVATYINEYKRRKDIVTKYLGDGNTTISEKMSRLSLHSVAKKSSRLGTMLHSTLFGVATKDPVFDEHELMFHTVEKTLRNFIKDVEMFLNGKSEKLAFQLYIGSSIVHFYQDSNSEAEDYQKLQQLISRRFFDEFRKIIERRVLMPLNNLIEFFEGPTILVQKRHDKLLDYDGCCVKAEKNKENRLIQEELVTTKSNYEALNSHLLEELPTLNSLAIEVLLECLQAFISARKLLSGKITREYLQLMETPLMKSCQGDAIETFPVKHSLVWNQLGRFTFSPKTGKTDTLTRKSSKSPTLTPKEQKSEPSLSSQSPSQQAYLQSRYPRDMLFSLTCPYLATEPLELSADKGIIVGVLKKHDPLGDTRMWFVDDGTTKGFIPSNCLEPLYQNVAAPPQNVARPPQNVARPPQNMATPFRNTIPPSREVAAPPPQKVQSPHQKVTTSPQNLAVSRAPPAPPSYEEVMSSSQEEVSLYEEIASPSQEESCRYEEITSPSSQGGNRYEEILEFCNSSVYEDVPDGGACSSEAGFYYAMYDFQGSDANTLSMKSGQVLLVMQQQDLQGNPGWWYVEDRFGNKGYVPGNYLRKYQ